VKALEFLPAQAGFGRDRPDPFWAATGATLYLGDARQCLRGMSERSVHCVVTSPPYWGLRDYGTGTWEGGSAECDHKPKVSPRANRPLGLLAGGTTTVDVSTISHVRLCSRCGARRTDAQMGAEASPDCGTGGQAQCGECFVCSMVGVFREVYRVLRDDGTVWLNLGDSYSGSWGARGRGLGTNSPRPDLEEKHGTAAANRSVVGLADGNLIGVPWRVALALQADGWVLRSDLPWVKRSAMPDSAENRPGKCLEYVFLLAKGSGYYFDMNAVRPTATTPTGAGGACFGRVMDEAAAQRAGAASRRYKRPDYTDRAFRNSDLWFQSVDRAHGMVGSGDEVVGLDVTPHSARGQKKTHFAVFPPALITPLILASTSEHGCCAACGRPWERVAARVTEAVRPAESGARAEADAAGSPCPG
jgi:hypothetical protein